MISRRKFLERGAVLGAAVSLSGILECKKSENVTHTLPRRKFGRTEEMLSLLGLGGVVLMNEEQSIANETVAMAYDRGVTYYDVAPTYGNAEERMGPALAPYRKNCFLACKTRERSREGAEKELDESLKKLQTDYFDLYQLHALSDVKDVETVFGPDGAMECYLKARDAGKIRYIGFSAHSQEAALLALDKFDLDTILFPINYVCWHQGNFGHDVVELARKRNMGISALKSLGRTLIREGEEKKYEKCWYHPVPYENDRLVSLAMRFTLSLADVMVPPGEPIYFWKAVDHVHRYQPLNDIEKKELIRLSEGVEPIFKA